MCEVSLECIHDHPLYLVCPDVLSLVELLSGEGCGSSITYSFSYFLFTYLFIYLFIYS